MLRTTVLHTLREMSVMEEIAACDMSTAEKLDAIFDAGKTFTFSFSNIITIHAVNDSAKKEEDREYDVYLYTSDDGNMYSSGSEPLRESIENIIATLERRGCEWRKITVEISKIESKNYKSKYFMKARCISFE